MSIQDIDHIRLTGRTSGFARDIIWALGMCMVSLSLTPALAVYVLLVA